LIHLRKSVGTSGTVRIKSLKNARPGNLMQAIYAGLLMAPTAVEKSTIHGRAKWKNAEPAKCLTVFLKQKKEFKTNE
jgi:hypothetical protein